MRRLYYRAKAMAFVGIYHFAMFMHYMPRWLGGDGAKR